MSLPGAYVRQFLDLLAERNVAIEPLLAGLAVDIESLDAPATRVPLVVCEAILARAFDVADETEIGFALAARIRVSAHGFLGFAAMTAGTVREAVELAIQFSSTRTSAVTLAIHVDAPSAFLVIEERMKLPPLIRRLIVTTLVVGFREWALALTGKPIGGTAELAFPEPSYRFHLPDDVKVRFDAPAHRLVFASSFLDEKLLSADPIASRLAREQCERELALFDGRTVPGQVRALLAKGAEHRSLDEVAKALRMSPRTLKRKLSESGATFSQIRDEFRRQRALILLDMRDLSVGEVAIRLGYTEIANFTRAFRKWTGMTPYAYRTRPPAT
jgi:AraC-like DNA-binding protein